MTDERSTDGRSLVRDGDRLKAYRPLPAGERLRLLDHALDVFAAGDFFEAHEILEPAWMGTADPRERAVLGGLIKLAAGYVHAVRGNATGMRKNLAGARERLVRGAGRAPDASGSDAVALLRIDVDALVDAIDARLDALDARGEAAGAGIRLVDRVPPPAVGRTRG
jgi:predicted metal-dependent hydrolase